MRNEGKITRLNEAKEKGEKIKLIFQYNSDSKVFIRQGYVLETYDDSFAFDERIEGRSIYSYDFLIEIREIKEDRNNE